MQQISLYSARATRMVNSCQTKTLESRIGLGVINAGELGFTRKRDAKRLQKTDESITKACEESRQSITNSKNEEP